MDDIDKKILSIIQKDATIPLSELSKKIENHCNILYIIECCSIYEKRG